MADELKILITGELDESATIQNISSQLSSMGKKLGSSGIEISATLNGSDISSQAQKIAKEVSQAVKSQNVDVTLNLDKSSISKIQSELNKLGVSDNVTKAMTQQLDRMGIQVDSITGKWASVNGEQEKMLNLQIRGTDALQRTVTYMQTYDAETGEVNTTLTNITANLNQQRQAQEKVSAQATKWLSTLDDIKASYEGTTSSNGVMDETRLKALNDKYDEIKTTITNLTASGDALTQSQKAWVNSMIADLQREAKGYQTVEAAAVQAQKVTDTRGAYIVKQFEKLSSIQASYQTTVADEAHLSSLDSYYKKCEEYLNEMATVEGNLSQSEKAHADMVISSLQQKVSAYQAEESAAAQAAASEESRLASLSKYYDKLTNLKASYSATSESPITDSGHLTSLGTACQNLENYLDGLITKNGELSASEKSTVDSMVSNIQRLIKVYQAEESAAAQAQSVQESNLSYLSKQLDEVAKIESLYTGESSSKPVTDTSHLESLKKAIQDIYNEIEKLMEADDSLSQSQKSNVESMINKVKLMVKEYQNLEYVATSLRTKTFGEVKLDQSANLDQLENQLQSAGILTEGFKSKIEELRTSLNNVNTKEGLTSWLNSFDSLNNDVNTFQQRLNSAKKIYTEILQVEQNIINTQASMLTTDPDSNEAAVLQKKLELYNQERDALYEQLTPYSDVLSYAQQAANVENTRKEALLVLESAEASLADKAQAATTAMEGMPTVVESLQTKFNSLQAPTETLQQNMTELKTLVSSFSDEMSDQEKVSTWEKVNQLVSDCRKEMTSLNQVQNSDVKDFKFTQNLTKAKAELEAVGLKWSALKNDPGLNSQFEALQQSLANVNNEMDLSKWNAQFSAFKSQVKAAGKDCQSFGDIMKNNITKVTQWASATTILYKSFSLLKEAITTITELDTAMTELKKVTEETSATYEEFYYNANETAKALGVTTEEVISATAEWARLGYSLEQAALLAENSAIFSSISEDLDIEDATDGLVSIIKAFDIEAEDSLDGIISKINEVGNNYAVSNSDIVNALTRSSSAMAAANNSLEETIALATSAIEITRDAESVGNGLKTLSMRIRGNMAPYVQKCA